MTASVRLTTDIEGKRHLPPVAWDFANADAAELAYRQAIDAINRVYLIPGNAYSPQEQTRP